jgi:hypothetical protein
VPSTCCVRIRSKRGSQTASKASRSRSLWSSSRPPWIGSAPYIGGTLTKACGVLVSVFVTINFFRDGKQVDQTLLSNFALPAGDIWDLGRPNPTGIPEPWSGVTARVVNFEGFPK